MTLEQIIFIVIAALTLGTAIMVVVARNLVHAALWLVGALFGVAVIFAMLQAGFLAVVQVLIYIGAIAILMIFAIMLTRKIASPSSEVTPRYSENWRWGILIAALMLIALFIMLVNWPAAFVTANPIPGGVDPLRDLGEALVAPDGFVLAFELASVLLLAALIGAIVVAWERK
jgi:NADH-quinone oxidoreductase subunit J